MEENHLYEAEVSPKEIIKKMKANIYDNYFKNSYHFISSDYLLTRSSLFSLIRKISNKLGFKSQTYFLSIYYLDILFSKNKKIDCNYKILGLACLLLAAKYVENDPCVPNLPSFIRVYNNIIGYKYIISVTDLFYAEVLACKMLSYKLNYYTIYDFDSFFFGHGIIKIEQLRELNDGYTNYNSNNFEINASNSIHIRKILEKIYRKSRHYLELIVNNSQICLKYNSLLISIFIMKKSVEEILFDEQRINKHDLLNKEKFLTKTSKYFREIMIELYETDYESIEAYLELISDKDLIKLLQEEKKSDMSPALVDLENNIKYVNDIRNQNNIRNKLTDNYNNNNNNKNNNNRNTIFSYSHVNRLILNYNNDSLNNTNTIINNSLNDNQILKKINLVKNLSKYKNTNDQKSSRLASNSKYKNNSSLHKKNLVSNYLDLSNLSSKKELSKIDSNIEKYRNERENRALSRHSEINSMKYLQKITNNDLGNKKINESYNINKKNNKSISIENEDEIIDLINTIDDKNKTINIESPIKFEKNSGFNFDNYKKLNGLRRKALKSINTYGKNLDCSSSLINSSNTLNTAKLLDSENISKIYKKFENIEKKPYFRKVIRNTTNPYTLNNVNFTINTTNTINLKQGLSQKTIGTSYFPSINYNDKRKKFNSIMANPFPLNYIEKDNQLLNSNSTKKEKNYFEKEINFNDKESNKNRHNININININTYNKEDINEGKSKINSLREKLNVNQKIKNNNLFNLKKNLFRNKEINEEKEDKQTDNLEKKDNKENDNKDNDNRNKDNKDKDYKDKDIEEDKNKIDKNDEIIKKENKEIKIDKENIKNKESKDEKINKEEKDKEDKEDKENKSNSELYSYSSSNSYINKRKERERLLIDRMKIINNKKNNNYDTKEKEDKFNNIATNDENNKNKDNISNNNSNKYIEVKKSEKSDVKINYKRRIKNKENNNETEKENNIKEINSYVESKPIIKSKRKYFLLNKKSSQNKLNEEDNTTNTNTNTNINTNNNINNQTNENIYEIKINIKNKEPYTEKKNDIIKESKYKSIRHKYINKIHNKNKKRKK